MWIIIEAHRRPSSRSSLSEWSLDFDSMLNVFANVTSSPIDVVDTSRSFLLLSRRLEGFGRWWSLFCFQSRRDVKLANSCWGMHMSTHTFKVAPGVLESKTWMHGSFATWKLTVSESRNFFLLFWNLIEYPIEWRDKRPCALLCCGRKSSYLGHQRRAKKIVYAFTCRFIRSDFFDGFAAISMKFLLTLPSSKLS